MRYQVMMLNVHEELRHTLMNRFSKMDVNFIMALTMQDAMRLYTEQSFHLLVLQFSDFTLCSEFFLALRHINFVPAIALIDKYDVENACDVLKAGADLCIDARWPIDLSVDHIMAQFRRYTSYNQTESHKGRDAANSYLSFFCPSNPSAQVEIFY